jgi:hypothetical protein
VSASAHLGRMATAKSSLEDFMRLQPSITTSRFLLHFASHEDAKHVNKSAKKISSSLQEIDGV